MLVRSCFPSASYSVCKQGRKKDSKLSEWLTEDGRRFVLEEEQTRNPWILFPHSFASHSQSHRHYCFLACRLRGMNIEAELVEKEKFYCTRWAGEFLDTCRLRPTICMCAEGRQDIDMVRTLGVGAWNLQGKQLNKIECSYPFKLSANA